MFSFGARKRFNGSVDLKIRNDYDIATHGNPKFAGALGFLTLLDMAWQSKMNVEEASMYIATLYYCGLVEHGHGRTGEAGRLSSKFFEISNRDYLERKINQERFEGFQAAVRKSMSGS